MSQYELAKLAGISRTTLKRIENGENSVGVHILARIAKALKISTSRLVK